MSMDLAEFLLARIAEDDDAAKRAAFGYGAGWTSVSDDVDDWSTVHADGKRDMVGCEDRDVTRHIARHDPARVLAECEAKRRIVELHHPSGEYDPDSCVLCQWDIDCDAPKHEHQEGSGEFPCPTLRLLALPYADRPGFREEWKP